MLKWLKNLLSKKSPEENTKSLKEVCVFPLPNVVLIPGLVLPLHIFEDRYKLMTEEAIKNNLPLAMSLSKVDKNGQPVPSSICGAGKMNLLNSFPDGRKDIFVEGHQRYRLIKYTQTQPFIKALAEAIPDLPYAIEADETNQHQQLKSFVRRWVFLSPDLDDSYLQYIDLFAKPHMLADFIAFYFLPTSDQKQSYLETLSRQKRVEWMLKFLEEKIGQLEKIQNASPKNLNATPSRILH